MQNKGQNKELSIGESCSRSFRDSPVSFGGRKPIGSSRETGKLSEQSIKIDDLSEQGEGTQMSKRQMLGSVNRNGLQISVTDRNG